VPLVYLLNVYTQCGDQLQNADVLTYDNGILSRVFGQQPPVTSAQQPQIEVYSSDCRLCFARSRENVTSCCWLL